MFEKIDEECLEKEKKLKLIEFHYPIELSFMKNTKCQENYAFETIA